MELRVYPLGISKVRLAVKLLRQLTKWSGGAKKQRRTARNGERSGCEVTVSTSGLINNAESL